VSDNPVEREIRASGADDSVTFVFPSDIAAALWLEAALGITGRGTIPSGRFIAWDRFKERAVQATVAGKTPVSAILRQLYALDLARRNREAATPIFSSLIPPAYADTSAAFAPWIARVLPSLALLERRRSRSSRAERDGEDRDLVALKDDYARFLEANSLFEPSWQLPPLVDSGERFVVFFPEAIEDYSEYEPVIEDAPFVRAVSAFGSADARPAIPTSPGARGGKGPGQLDFFDADPVTDDPTGDEDELSLASYPTTRDELKAVALAIENLLREGIPPETIAVSVPDLDTVAPYLTRELALRSIPFEFRAGSPLGARPSGRFFALAADCVASGFAFTQFKALLLDRSVPWKDRNLAEDLVSFGIRNHCVTGWREGAARIDVWEAAFRDPAYAERGDWRIGEWYGKLSRALASLVGSAGFSEIRNRWFSFRESFLDVSLLSPEDDAVLARCVEELASLAALEERFPSLVPAEPFALFVSVLADKKYVRRRAETGVNIFPYRVAAGTPFPYHFIINASQDDATVMYRPLGFLRDDKRSRLLVSDSDASRAFFNLYRICPLPAPRAESANATEGTVEFSFSRRTFTGYRIPHSAFAREEEGAFQATDPFALETAWLLGRGSEPDRLYPVQKAAFDAWRARDGGRNFSYLTEPFGERVEPLTARVRARFLKPEGTLVTATHLNAWATCGAKLLLGQVLSVEEESQDAELMNERNIGILYHDVLCTVYRKIRDEDGSFRKERADTYLEWLALAARDSAGGYAEFRGPLAAPLIDTLADRIIEGAAAVIRNDAERLDGFAPVVLEGKFSHSSDGILYYGQIDRISADAEGNAVLIDYKSGFVTPTADYEVSGEGAIGDFQIPLYTLLAERAEGSPCKGSKLGFAWFADIRKGKYQPVVHDRETIPWGSRSRLFSREEFEPSMQALARTAERYARALAEADFTRPKELPWTECASCAFRKICRRVYQVRP
jgi:hypothetical protein